MTQQQYRSPITRAVVQLVQNTLKGSPDKKADKNLKQKSTQVIMEMAWKMIEPQFPMMLYGLDHDPEALAAIQRLILEVSQENLAEQRGPGFLAWVTPECPIESKWIQPLCGEEKDAGTGNQKLG